MSPRSRRPGLPRLSKSRYLAGRQCERRLWLEVYELARATPPSAVEAARLATGTALGALARSLFPGSVLVDQGPDRFPEAELRTRALLANPLVPAILEAAFEHEGVRIRVDALERVARGRFRLVEVKGGTKVKPVHVDDLAVQRFVLEGRGLTVVGCDLLHLEPGYRRGEGPLDVEAVFARTDLTAAVQARLPSVLDEVARLHGVLALRSEPEVEPGGHCHRPWPCPFWAHCTREKPRDWVFTLPRLGARRHAELIRRGVERIPEIPDAVPLDAVQRRIRAVLRGERPPVEPGLGAALRASGPPAFYLDFETMSPALPLYPGTRPYEAVPFQFSLHRADASGRLAHRAFLAEAGADPRPALAAALVSALRELEAADEEARASREATPILVWSSYEAGILRELARAVPLLAGALEEARARLVDLLPVVRRQVYLPEFGGSFSIKRVAPALAPGVGWDEAGEVHEGGEAALAFERLATGQIAEPGATRLRAALRAYCERDTWALAHVHAALHAAAAGGPPAR